MSVDQLYFSSNNFFTPVFFKFDFITIFWVFFFVSLPHFTSLNYSLSNCSEKVVPTGPGHWIRADTHFETCAPKPNLSANPVATGFN